MIPNKWFLRAFLVIAFISSVAVVFLNCSKQRKQPIDWVDMFYGTAREGGTRTFFKGFASLPDGMVKLGPDNMGYMRNKEPGIHWVRMGYHYQSKTILGFNHIHSVGLGGILVMPTSGELQVAPGDYDRPEEGFRSAFRHETEESYPGYYKVLLDDNGIKAEMTATTRVGYHRYTFPDNCDGHILIDIGHQLGESPAIQDAEINIDKEKNEIEGFFSVKTLYGKPRPVYYVAMVDTDFDDFGTWVTWEDKKEVHKGNSRLTGQGTGAYLDYKTGNQSKQVVMKVALSHVSLDQARLNMEEEAPDFNFDRVRKNARKVWNEELSRVEVEGGTDEQKTIFYTSLYHMLVGRTIDSDVNGYYRGMMGDIHRIDGWEEGYHHIMFDGIWASWWAINPLFTLIKPHFMNDWARSLIHDYRDINVLPRSVQSPWTAGDSTTAYVMIGAQSTPFIVGNYMKGIRDFDVETAYQGMLRNALVGFDEPPEGLSDHHIKRVRQVEPNTVPRGLLAYDCDSEPYLARHGYIPTGVWGSVSKTLEHVYSQWALAEFARVLGKEKDHALFSERAGYYKNLFDHETRLMRPRHPDGTWLADFKQELLTSYGIEEGFVEGYTWNYSWYVPHDPLGLAQLMGGRKAAADKLVYAFEKQGTWFTVHNEPYRGIAWLFNYFGYPWLTQKWVRATLENEFGMTPQGYYDDDDQGNYSGWYVHGAIGLFQERGGCAEKPVYELGSPIFDKITIHLGDHWAGKKFVIETVNNSKENKYIQSVNMDGMPVEKPWIYNSEIIDGGTLVIELGPRPNKAWGSDPEDAPPSMTGLMPEAD